MKKNLKKIERIVNSTLATSLAEVAKASDLSEFYVKFLLVIHPKRKKKIMNQLTQNRKRKHKKQNVLGLVDEQDFNIKPNSKFVIDASICGYGKKLDDIIQKIFDSNSMIVLTSITIKELEKMQKFNDTHALYARRILRMAAKMPHHFRTVIIDESETTPDDCIIKYCADHQNEVILLTSDKTMVLKARMYDIRSYYFKHDLPRTPIEYRHSSVYPTQSHSNIITLFPATEINGKLVLSNFNTDRRSCMVISNDVAYTEGPRELKIGDDVFVGTKKPRYWTFAHYLVVSLNATNNCRLIFSRRIYDKNKIKSLPRADYRDFMKDFALRHDL